MAQVAGQPVVVVVVAPLVRAQQFAARLAGREPLLLLDWLAWAEVGALVSFVVGLLAAEPAQKTEVLARLPARGLVFDLSTRRTHLSHDESRKVQHFCLLNELSSKGTACLVECVEQ